MIKSLIYKIPTEIKIINNSQDLILEGPLGCCSIKEHKKSIRNIYKNKIYLKSKKNIGLIKILNKRIGGLLRGFKFEVSVSGLGNKIGVQDNVLILNLGFSHPVHILIPEDINIFVENDKCIIIYGIHYEQLTRFVDIIIKTRKVNRFTGHGLRFKKNFF